MNTCKKSKLPPKVEDMTKEEIVFFLKKKRDCEATAQSVVISLLENEVSEALFLRCLPRISQSHYEDVNEERAISKLCGYPLCRKNLPDKLPSQKYIISCKTNKVYDITARKNFCTNICYEASVFIKDQISISPLWYRENESVPNFKLLSHETKGIIGDEIDLSLVKKVNLEETKENSFNSFLDFTEASLTEISKDPEGKDVVIESVEIDVANDEKENELAKETGNDTKPEIEIKDESKKSAQKESKKTVKFQDNVDEPKSKLKLKSNLKGKILGEIFERKHENKTDPIIGAGQILQDSVNEARSKRDIHKQRKVQKKQSTPMSVAIIHIEKCLGEWFTLETMLFLFGKDKVKQMVEDKGECIKEHLNNIANGLFYKSTSYDQYQLLCRKLNLLELEDRKFDSKITSARESKPLPHYSMLQEESAQLDIKVRAFLKGEMEIPIEKKRQTIDTEKNTVSDESTTNLPLVDKTAQHALRRKIVLNSLDKVLPDLLQSLGLTPKKVSSDVRLLVATFNLQAHNIIFKPAQWNMIVMIFVKLLSVRDIQLKGALERDMANRHMQLLLLNYEQDGGYLDRFIAWLTDIDRLLDSENKQLTEQGSAASAHLVTVQKTKLSILQFTKNIDIDIS